MGDQLKARRVLLAESDVVVAMDLMFELENQGLKIASLSSSLEGALQAVAHMNFDFALLNFRLPDGHIYPVVEKLEALDIPFAFFSGSDRSELREAYRDVPFFAKPQDPRCIAERVKALVTLLPQNCPEQDFKRLSHRDEVADMR